MESNQCFASVIILNWNAEKFLPACFAALEKQTFQDFEVILLNNGSEGASFSIPELQFLQSRLSILNSATNLGFAAGNNLAARQAKGEYIVLLNADAFPKPDWLEKIHQACIDHPHHFFASRLIKANNPQTLDGEWN